MNPTFNAADGLVTNVSEFCIGTVATQADDRIVYDQANGLLYYDADGSGSGAAVQIALIGTTIHPTLTNGGLFIV